MEQPSPLSQALATVADRWKLAVVAALLDGPRRFGEISEAIEEGLVLARPYSERPQRFLYELTAAGQDLAGVLRLLSDWGARHRGGEPFRHAACGTPLEARWYCPTCHEPVDETAGLDTDGLFYA
jgi:DNA-binding HxlR family transcriptional regulator